MSGRLGMTGLSTARGDRTVVIGKAAPRERRDRSGNAVGAGSVIGGVGLVGGGVPGARPDSGRLAHVRYGTKYEATRHLVSATRGGVFGYRADAHQSFLNRQNADEVAHGGKKTTRVNHYLRGQGTGKIEPEIKVIRHMKTGRAFSNAALLGGMALVAAGTQSHKRHLAKRDTYRSDVLVSGGLTTAGLGGGGSLLLDSQGRKWSRRSAESLDAARKLNPKTGGYDVRRTKTRVPDVVPHRGSGAIVEDHKRTFAGRSSNATKQVGRLRGAAGQQRYFARVYGGSARYARKVGGVGALVAAAGLGSKYVGGREVRKSRIPYTSAWEDERGRIYFPAHGDQPVRPARPAPTRPPQAVPPVVRAGVRGLSRRHALVGAGALVATGGTGYALGRRRVRKSGGYKQTMVNMAGPLKAVQRGGVHSPLAEENAFYRRLWKTQNKASRAPRTEGGRNFLMGAGVAQKRPIRTFNMLEDHPTARYERIRGQRVTKVDTTMSEREAHRLASQYDTRGPLPKGLSREQKMKAYEARYIASGGKKGEVWQRRADRAEVARNVGLAGATISAGALMATRGRRTGPRLARAKITSHRAETAALGSALLGGTAELFGEHARNRRASYANTPAGVAGSALSRMRAYTPGGQK